MLHKELAHVAVWTPGTCRRAVKMDNGELSGAQAHGLCSVAAAHRWPPRPGLGGSAGRPTAHMALSVWAPLLPAPSIWTLLTLLREVQALNVLLLPVKPSTLNLSDGQSAHMGTFFFLLSFPAAHHLHPFSLSLLPSLSASCSCETMTQLWSLGQHTSQTWVVVGGCGAGATLVTLSRNFHTEALK